MNYLKKILKFFLTTLISIAVSSLILTVIYYFDIINGNTYNIIKMGIVIISLLVNSFLLGKNSNKYGLVEGLKLGGLFLILTLIISAVTKTSFGIRTLIYSIIILLTTGAGAVIGINRKVSK